MKRFSILTLVLMSTLIISACGAQATPIPTVNVADMQNTMAAAAFTMIAETQAAIPTATPTAPPTDTPVPTVTLPPLPTLDATFTAVPSGTSGAGDPCINTVLPATLTGETVKIRDRQFNKSDSFAHCISKSNRTPKCMRISQLHYRSRRIYCP